MLKTRVITAVVLLGLFLPALFYLPMMWWASAMLLLTLVCLHEWAGFLQLSPTQTWIYLTFATLTGVALLVLLQRWGFHWFFYHALQVFIGMTFFWLIVVPVAMFFNTFFKQKAINLFLGCFLMLSLWMALVTAQEVNPYVLLVIISTIWLADTAAYFFGKKFGQHKLAPAISPGKTWEGVLGALLVVGVYAVTLKATGAVTTWWVLPGLWMITIVGVYGDLFESFFKRRANLKDSGQFLPGHGGFLDRVDGVIPALPVGLCLVFWFHYWQQSYSF
ncbi:MULTISPECIES: phosphatidate cytidylyltransferase [unclassified Methylophilus]|uniref:phosphatidate cytidylyltransferase n=1 Tax=unclassified Methylophilus TaxID=2630143 RepID=UPI0006F1FDAB|nr:MULTISPECIES: phosphatidate cytidylyltransferase [unclassified Methylophilus]KQT43549.1 phosphatidate cytidylyltransferase [Methylophilus sp. Leaf416]KQT59035.1 phosphatidate cytidylyltransferase [Methylophilus sp. Leaf459]